MYSLNTIGGRGYISLFKVYTNSYNERWFTAQTTYKTFQENASRSSAPKNLVQMLLCTCKSGCGTACGCRKTDLNWSVACIHCSGNSWSNPSPLERLDEVDGE